MLCKIKYWNPIRKKFFFISNILFGSPKRAEYEIHKIEEEQQKLLKKGKPVTMTKFKICNTAGRTLHLKKKTI